MNFKEVTEDEQYEFYRHKNVSLTPTGNYPYGMDFKERNELIAYSKDGRHYILANEPPTQPKEKERNDIQNNTTKGIQTS